MRENIKENKRCLSPFTIKTFGCQMANRDSEVIAGLLDKAGYTIVDDEKKADVVIFNTCSVRQHAEDRVFSAVGACKAKIIGVVGCMANNYRQAIFQKAPKVDFVVGTRDIHKITEIINKFQSPNPKSQTNSNHQIPNSQNKTMLGLKILETHSECRPDEIYHTGFHLDLSHAFVVISEGCENYCSYCIVPYVRGKLRSRSQEDIIKEIKDDISAGISKITLLGQNVNAYHSPSRAGGRHACPLQKPNFLKLLQLVNEIPGLKEFTFMTSHPKDANKELFKAMQECSKIKKHLHLPVQSGSNKILKLMNRGYTKEHYLDLVKEFRAIVKNGILSTDIIVGFPGETEEGFCQTYDLVKEVKFNNAYIFKYSPRPHTEALKYEDSVSKQEKERRHRLILDLQREISNESK